MTVRDPVEDRDYFVQRAQEARELAATSEDNAPARAHLDMTDEYSRRAEALAVQSSATATQSRSGIQKLPTVAVTGSVANRLPAKLSKQSENATSSLTCRISSAITSAAALRL